MNDCFLAIGLMSGTSMDGVDCAMVQSDGQAAGPLGKPVHLAYSEDMRHEMARGMSEAAKLGHPSLINDSLHELEKKLTHIHGQVVAQFLSENELTSGQIDVIGFHGQTLLHKPDAGWSWQIGDGHSLADMCQIPVINDFRSCDMENGGQGAPLVPIYHQALVKSLPGQGYPVAIINIGGVSNITWIGSADEGDMLAFDCGPGNALLNDWVNQHTGQPMDRDGRLAAKGKSDHILLTEWLSNPYFSKIPPKSLDRNSFNVAGLERLSLEDGAASLLEFTVKSIDISLNHCPKRPQKIYICGGGRHNKRLMAELGKFAIPVDNVEALGWNGDFLEAEAFAFLAIRHLAAVPLTYPGTTGVNCPCPGGKLHSVSQNLIPQP